MIKTLLIDDDELSRLNLRLICEQLEEVKVCGEFDNALKAYEFHKLEPVDLLFLDIEMPQFSGLDLVRSIEHLPHIIFITSKEGYAATAFDYLENVVDYIVKPVSMTRLQKALKRYEQLIEPIPTSSDVEAPLRQEFIFVKADKKYIRIDLEDLLYIEMMGDYAIFKTHQAKIVINNSLKSITNQLQHDYFLRVHRSYIVNISKIENIEHNSLVIEKKVIPISRTYRPTLLDRLSLI